VQVIAMSLFQPIVRVVNLRRQLSLYLERFDISASQLSRKSGVAKQTISNWLAGQTPKDLNQVKSVANVLGTSIDNLCFGDGLEKKEDAALLDALSGDGWASGVFEIKFRRVKK
jgi:transcriptional regulator with XRE-family HTH domain